MAPQVGTAREAGGDPFRGRRHRRIVGVRPQPLHGLVQPLDAPRGAEPRTRERREERALLRTDPGAVLGAEALEPAEQRLGRGASGGGHGG
jgi:hypothetical protein